jgi:cysteine desulfuration protein SufE
LRAALKSHSQACRVLIDHHLFGVFLAEKLQRTVDDLAVLDDPQERLGALVDRAKRRPPLPPEDRTEANRVRGCVSVVWLAGDMRDGRCFFRSDAESPVVRGLVSFLGDFFSDAPVGEVAASELEPLDALDVTRNLSPTRRNGLAAARKAIREFAQGAVKFSSPSPEGANSEARNPGKEPSQS